METFWKIFDILKPVTIFKRSCILDVWLSSKYASDSIDNNIIMSMSHIVKKNSWKIHIEKFIF